MLFNSYIFILAFYPITLIGYYSLNIYFPKSGNTAAKGWLLLASLVFYGYFNPSYLAIIITSILVNYYLSRVMLKNGNELLRKAAYALGLALNIGCLFFYKYYDFFITNTNALFKTSFPLINVVLPLGISFFTFQQLSYVIDSYKRKVPEYSILDYALFVSFFPQLVAGPIVLHNELVPQFANKENQKFNYDNFGKGIFAFSIGLAKKVLLADTFGIIANWGFGSIETLGTVNAAIVMLAYTLQIYLDFSGYSDMAIGLGYMFNIELPINFNSPYKAITIADFWKRWHITLTRFFTTYIYIPMGGSRVSTRKTLFNIMVVFLVSGIWHGANWTFIVWGLAHGIALVMCRVLNVKPTKSKIANAGLWLCTFLFVNLAWVIFRADSLHDAALFFEQLVSFNSFSISEQILGAFQFRELEAVTMLVPVIGQTILDWASILACAAVLAGILVFRNTKELTNRFSQPKTYHAVISAALLVWSVMSFSGVSTFLYWNF